jgi:two-component system sensor histidine kinase BaeS
MLRTRIGLAGRLFAAQVLVVLAGWITLAVVAAAIGPVIFHDHLLRTAGHVTADTTRHIEQAYTSASAVSLGVALLAALGAAVAASAYLARRVASPIAQLAAAAADVAEGRYATRVVTPGLGTEFDTLAGAFNAMAARLDAAEATRRRLLADLGHEMRTPLATIEAYLEAAEDGVAVDDEDAVTVLRAQTGRLRRLAEDIAAVSRAEEHQLDLRPAPVTPGDLVATAVAAARPRYAAKGVVLDEWVSGDAPTVVADPQRIGQVLGNLLDNALRHTPPGGQVQVTAIRDGPDAQISVADTGEGIPADHLPHVFERFYRGDAARNPAHAGSGIGLTIVRTVVTGHGGRVTAHSAGAGAGATFTVTLPGAENQRGVRERPPSGVAGSTPSGASG